MIGDTQTAALVGRDGSIDWLCVPRFDSAACFAALLGSSEHGRWKIAPKAPVPQTVRRYREGTLVLETEFTTGEGVVRLVDCMPIRETAPYVVRVVEGVRGRVPMSMELVIRFDYGSVIPWVRSVDGDLRAVAGPDALVLRAGVPTFGKGLTTCAEFDVQEGQRIPFVLTSYPSHQPPPAAVDAMPEVESTEASWRAWSSRCTYRGPWKEAVVSSLVVLKALTYAPTGGLVAAPTTSLPEWIGGARNWDYRYCWLRDATFTLGALLSGGYSEEAVAWRDWLLRAVAGDPSKAQVLYGVAGERHLCEHIIPWLPGYHGSAPVRVGNAATEQLQLDVYGEVMDALHLAHRAGIPPEPAAWQIQLALMDYLESIWHEPDEGIWEVRGGRRRFTSSRVMVWVAFDRAIKTMERMGFDGPIDRWRQARATVHAEVCREGFDPQRNSFMQSYGSEHVDASTLLIPLVGFLPADDPRVVGTVLEIERNLMRGGLILRYPHGVDNLAGLEGVFLPCSFWLADCYALMGRTQDAQKLFGRLLGLRNDLGLLAEEYDPEGQQQLGNFPQAFSHLALIGTALALTAGQAKFGPDRRL